MKFLLSFIFIFAFHQMQAQLGFCTGSKGDPIFQENFGSGSGTGNELDTGITNYTFVRQDPEDGEYTISDDIGNNITSWHSYLPPTTFSGGRALIVNADFNADRFYKKEISGLCENTTYEFSAFLMNVYDRGSNICPGGGIPNNVKFEIWDETDSFLIKSGNTNDIISTTSPQWKQYALTFQSESGQSAVILKMFNNGDGGCGNDLAIDDIIFRSCGDLTEVTSTEDGSGSLEVCEENSPVGVKLAANPDNSVYGEHYYQWQKSENSEDWEDIPGATSASYEQSFIESTIYFRVKVAEDIVNLASNVCSSASEAFKVEIINTPAAPISNGDISACGNEIMSELSVSVNAEESVNWYDSETGGNLLAENTETFSTHTEGTYYAEAVNQGKSCIGSSRTAVKLTINPIPELEDEVLQICPESSLLLEAGFNGAEYLWNTGETSETIDVDSPGTYSVRVITLEDCSATKTILVEPVDDAQISEIISEGETVNIIPLIEGDFLYSLDGINYQQSNKFEAVPGGIYTAYIKDIRNCNIDITEFAHLVVPSFISPNNDGYNDNFKLKGVEFFEYSEIRILNRYGKLLKIDAGENFQWDGTLEGKDLPADDYWYFIKISGFEDRTGHFSLIR